MGPLAGLTVIELAGLGPAPIAASMLADLGAEVIRIERGTAGSAEPRPVDPLLRNRKSMAVNLKHGEGIALLLDLIAGADVLIEGFRPGVMEKLGLGPEVCLERNPRLIYGRATGWGQTGPLSRVAGHDINYIALTGMLHQVGLQGGRPVPPVCFAGDYGSGGYLLAFGVLAAWIAASKTGEGQVVDAAIVDGSAAMMGVFYAFRDTHLVSDGPGEGYLAGAAPWYRTYQTADDKYVAVGPLEPQFFEILLDKLGLDKERYLAFAFPAVDPDTRQKWPELRREMERAFRSRTRDEWCQSLEGSDACFSPVLDMDEALEHPHNLARELFIEVDGVVQNAPVPRFSGTPAAPVKPPARAGEDTDSVLEGLGYSDARIRQLRESGALA